MPRKVVKLVGSESAQRASIDREQDSNENMQIESIDNINQRIYKKARHDELPEHMKNLSVSLDKRFENNTEFPQKDNSETSSFPSEEEIIPTNKDTNGFTKTFPQRLIDMLQYKGSENIVMWTEEGEAFNIVNEELLSTKLLPLFFKRTKYLSFIRKINRWGFKRFSTGKNVGAFYHRFFLRDSPHLCLHMSCSTPIEGYGKTQQPLNKKANKEVDLKDEKFPETLKNPPASFPRSLEYHQNSLLAPILSSNPHQIFQQNLYFLKASNQIVLPQNQSLAQSQLPFTQSTIPTTQAQSQPPMPLAMSSAFDQLSGAQFKSTNDLNFISKEFLTQSLITKPWQEQGGKIFDENLKSNNTQQNLVKTSRQQSGHVRKRSYSDDILATKVILPGNVTRNNSPPEERKNKNTTARQA